MRLCSGAGSGSCTPMSSTIKEQWDIDGYVVLRNLLAGNALDSAVSELDQMFPTADGFHSQADPRHTRFRSDEFDGIDEFPFKSRSVNLLAADLRLIDLAKSLLAVDSVRIYSAEAWAKFAGATRYDQPLHRDALGHTLTVPTTDERFGQVEFFVYLSEVTASNGAPQLVSAEHTGQLGIKPNWLHRDVGEHDDEFEGLAPPGLYDAERAAVGPPGTVVAFKPSTFHRATELVESGSARYTMHVNYRRAEVEWADRRGWASIAHDEMWYDFVEHATPEQLEVFGFPRPGHAFWTPTTLSGVQARYPGLDMQPWLLATEKG
jgi:hypothetical protein